MADRLAGPGAEALPSTAVFSLRWKHQTRWQSCNEKRAAFRRPLEVLLSLRLQRGFDFESPSFEKRFGDILRVLVAACPLPQAGRPEILVRGEFVLAHNLLKLGDGRDYRPYRLRLAPVWISASLGHETLPFLQRGINSTQIQLLYLYDSPNTFGDSWKNIASAGANLLHYPTDRKKLIGDSVS